MSGKKNSSYQTGHYYGQGPARGPSPIPFPLKQTTTPAAQIPVIAPKTQTTATTMTNSNSAMTDLLKKVAQLGKRRYKKPDPQEVRRKLDLLQSEAFWEAAAPQKAEIVAEVQVERPGIPVNAEQTPDPKPDQQPNDFPKPEPNKDQVQPSPVAEQKPETQTAPNRDEASKLDQVQTPNPVVVQTPNKLEIVPTNHTPVSMIPYSVCLPLTPDMGTNLPSPGRIEAPPVQVNNGGDVAGGTVIADADVQVKIDPNAGSMHRARSIGSEIPKIVDVERIFQEPTQAPTDVENPRPQSEHQPLPPVPTEAQQSPPVFQINTSVMYSKVDDYQGTVKTAAQIFLKDRGYIEVVEKFQKYIPSANIQSELQKLMRCNLRNKLAQIFAQFNDSRISDASLMLSSVPQQQVFMKKMLEDMEDQLKELYPNTGVPNETFTDAKLIKYRKDMEGLVRKKEEVVFGEHAKDGSLLSSDLSQGLGRTQPPQKPVDPDDMTPRNN